MLKDSGVTIKTSAKKVAVDRGAATVILPRREAKAIAGYITDSDYISKFLDPNELCVTAENRLHNLTYEAQVNNANRGYFSGLFYFLKSQPAGTRVRDVQNKACLSTCSPTLSADGLSFSEHKFNWRNVMQKPLSQRMHERVFGGSPLSTGLSPRLVAQSFGVVLPVAESLPQSAAPTHLIGRRRRATC